MGSEGASFASFRDLEAWRHGMVLAVNVYEFTAALPDSERFGLISQLRRAAVSIPSNLAEGHARGATRDFVRFIAIARGSLAEVETQVELASRLGYASTVEKNALLSRCDKLGRIMRGLRKSLENKLAQR